MISRDIQGRATPRSRRRLPTLEKSQQFKSRVVSRSRLNVKSRSRSRESIFKILESESGVDLKMFSKTLISGREFEE